MFIYKITNKENNLCYIGLDTHAEYRQKRWKDHRRDCLKHKDKFHTALSKGQDKFIYEVIFRTENISELIRKEIEYITLFDSYKNGYNSTPGGDAFNYRNLKNIDEKLYNEIISLRREWTKELNEKKWEDTTPQERKALCSHLHNKSVYKKKGESLEDYWASLNEEDKNKQLRGLKIEWKKDLDEEEYLIRCQTNKKNGQKGATKVSKKVKIEFLDGTVKIYNSKSEFNKEHGEIINAIIRKTKENKDHRGFKGWEINESAI